MDNELELERFFEQKFDDDFRELFTKSLKENEKFGHELWSALANVVWIHESDVGNVGCGHSFRSGGSLISEMLGRSGGMSYMEWYMGSPCETVSKYVADKLATKGWKHLSYEEWEKVRKN